MNQEWTSKDRWACMTSEASDGMLWGLHQSHLSRMWGQQSRQRTCAHVYRTSLGLVVGNHVLQSHQVQELLSIHEQINPDYPLTYTSQWHCNLWLLNSLLNIGNLLLISRECLWTLSSSKTSHSCRYCGNSLFRTF